MQPESRDNISTDERAVVVLGHGSRAANSGRPLEWVVEQLGNRLGCRVVAAFLQFNQPDLKQCCRDLVADGAGEIFIAPYFLFEGNHMLQDIPGEISELEDEFPQVAFKLTSALGRDDRLVQLLEKRLSEAGMVKAANGVMREGQHPIEGESFAIIDSLVAPEDPDDPRYAVSRRVVHATGDTALIDALEFSDKAISAAMQALAVGATLFCDVNMVAAGVEPTVERYGLQTVCGIASAATSALASAENITRGAAAFRRSYIDDEDSLDGAIVVIGNAPTALYEVLRLVREEGIRPALVIGVPVGFVGAAESKEELAASDLDFITLPGNRGGSNVAAAIVNALVRQWVASGKPAE